MKEYWLSLTQREQALLAAAGVTLLATLIYFFMVRPLFDYRAESERSFVAAEATFEAVQQRAMELQALDDHSEQAAESSAETVSLRVAVSNAARRAGVVISRLQPAENGALTVWAEGVQSGQMYSWLQVLADEQRVGPANVLVQKSTNGNTLRVQLRFDGAGR